MSKVVRRSNGRQGSAKRGSAVDFRLANVGKVGHRKASGFSRSWRFRGAARGAVRAIRHATFAGFATGVSSVGFPVERVMMGTPKGIRAPSSRVLAQVRVLLVSARCLAPWLRRSPP